MTKASPPFWTDRQDDLTEKVRLGDRAWEELPCQVARRQARGDEVATKERVDV